MTCTLCGLAPGEAAFCCAGCENVYAILVESGVVASGQNFRDTELFQRSLKLGLISNGSEGTGQRPVLQDDATGLRCSHNATTMRFEESASGRMAHDYRRHLRSRSH